MPDFTNDPTAGDGSPSAPDSAETSASTPPRDIAPPLKDVLVELDEHAESLGWDRPPTLFALVPTADLMKAEPELAASLGLTGTKAPADALTPIEQEALEDGPLDEVLSRIAWPDAVHGCVLVREALLLPPSAGEAPEGQDPVTWASNHPERREMRLAVAVLRGGKRAMTLRLRPTEDDPEPPFVRDDNLAPELAEALLETLA